MENNLDVRINGQDGLSPVLKNLESKLIRFVGAVSSALATLKIGAFPITAAANFEREMANVKKTTEFTKYEIDKLGDELKDLSLRLNVSATDLAKIASAAGQQGLGKTGVEGVRQFTESVARMSSVLDITAEQAATDLGKILNIFKEPIKQVENVSSAFNEVSNNSTASGAQLLDIVKRIGDAAGTINLTQSLGLAATGIDLGLSPEVVGTSFAKIFADMRAKADEFGRLMKMDAKSWIKEVDDDGINALKMYLNRLRQLDSQSQAATISKLSGQGRIFALMNKLVQDSNNDILQKNLENAQKGKDSGTSAIREQMTVLNTLRAQWQILQNSVFALGSKTGEQLLGPLTAYTAQLSAALQNPAVQSFFNAIGASFGDLIANIAGAIKVMAGWNVNWENFITLAKTLILLKLGEKAFGWVEGLGPKFIAQKKAYEDFVSIIKTGTVAQQANTAATAAGAQQQLTGIKAIIAAWHERANTALAVTNTEAELAARRAEMDAAEAARRKAQNDYLSSIQAERLARSAVLTTSAAVPATQSSGDARVAAAQATLNRKIQEAQAKHQQALTDIATRYQGARTNVAKAARDAEIVAADEHLRRQLAGLAGYHNRRIAAIQTQAAQELQVARAANDAAILEYQRLTASRTASSAALAAAAQNVANKKAAVDAASASLSAATNAAAAASTAFISFGTAARLAGIAVRGLLSAFSFVALWGTIIYSIVDMTIGIDKLTPAWQRLTDAIGLTSEAKRKSAQEDEQKKKALETEKSRVEELIKIYKDYLDVTGKLDNKKVGDLFNDVSHGGPDAQAKALQKLLQLQEAAQAQSDNIRNSSNKGQSDAQAYADKLAKDVAAAQQRLADLRKSRGSVFLHDGNIDKANEDIKKQETVVASLQVQYEKAAKAANDYGTQTAAKMAELVSLADGQQKEFANGFAQMFTDSSLQLAEKMIPIKTTEEALANIGAKMIELQQKIVTAGKDEGAISKLEQERKGYEEDQRAKLLLLQEQRKAYDELRSSLLALAKDSPAMLNSLSFVDSIISQMNNAAITRLTTQVELAKKSGVPLTGTLAPKAGNTQKVGDDAFNPKANTESEASKMAKAKYALRKAELQAQLAMEKEEFSQISALEQSYYDQGLSQLQHYFGQRERIALAGNAAEIQTRKLELEGLATKRKEVMKPYEKVQVDAEIARVKGEIAVLESQQKEISRSTERELKKVEDDFRKSIDSLQLDLMKELGTDNLDDFFGTQLSAYNAQWEKFMLQLAAEGKTDILNALQKQNELKALGDTLGQINQKSELAYGTLDRYLTRQGIALEKGLITTAQFETLSQKARAETAALIANDIADQEKRLNAMKGAGQEATLAYQKLAAQIDANKLQLEQLQAKADSVAREINTSIRSNIAGALNDAVTGPEGGFLGALRRFGAAVATTIRDAATKAFSEQIMLKVFGGVDGGIGGTISKMLGVGTPVPGSSPTNPIYNVPVGAGGSTDPTKIATDVAQGTEGGPLGSIKKVFDDVGGKFKDMFGDLLGSFKGLFSSLGDGLSNIFSSMMSSFSGGGGLASFFAFHTGGIVGGAASRRTVHPGVFANAMRYHTGGLAGLQPDEVPAILRKGEEVLTAGDPRHRNNSGATGDVYNITANVYTDGNTDVKGGGVDGVALGKAITSAVQKEIINQKRTGGLLAPK